MAWPVLPHGFLGTQGVLTDEDTYQIERSLRFNSADAPRLTRTPSVSSNRKTFTISFWVKRSLINGVRQGLFVVNPASPYFGIDFATTNVLNIYIGAAIGLTTTQVFRDTTSWSHFVISVDTTQATASDRVKLYHNGEQITSFTTATYPALNADLAVNTASYVHDIGSWGTSALYLNGYMAEVYLIDGSALTPFSFGETDSNTGRWRAKAFSGTYGTNGFYVKFADNTGATATTLGKDTSDYRLFTAQTDGATNGIQRGADLTGIANGKAGTISIWVNFTNSASAYNPIWISRNNTTIGNTLTLARSSTGELTLSARNSAGTIILDTTTTGTPCSSSGLYHIYATWDLAVNNRVYIYVNGTDKTGTISTFTNDTIQYSVPNHGLLGNLLSPFAPLTAAMVGQVYVNYSAYLDPTSNVTKFYGGVATPKGIGSDGSVPSGTSPIVYLDGNATTILTNRGTGGNFVAYGTLSTGTTYAGTGNHYNDFTPSNLSVTAGVGNDSLIDTPTNYGNLTHTFSDDTYQIERGLRFNSADTTYLSRTPAGAGNRKTWTWSGWVKRSLFGTAQTLFSCGTAANDTGQMTIAFLQGANVDSLRIHGYSTNFRVTTLQFKDPSVWYHIVVSIDSTNATASNRIKMYVNGSEITSFITSNDLTLNADYGINQALQHGIGRYEDGATSYLNGYLTEINFIDGQALTPDNFGVRDANTYAWKPKAYSGAYGTNGFYLKFADNSGTTSTTLGKDSSGNNNNWTPNSFSVSSGVGNDSLVDSPTYYGTDAGAGGEARGEYCILDSNQKTAAITISNGGLDYSQTASAGIVFGTLAVSSGKWYWEMHFVSGRNMTGIAEITTPVTSTYVGTTAMAYAYYSLNGNKYNNGTNSVYGATFTTGDIIGVALNLDAGTLEFFKNNVSQGVAFTGLSGTFSPAIGDAIVGVASFNFGQRPFVYAAPTGFKTLRDYNRQLVPTGGVIRGNYATMNDINPVKPTGYLNGALQISGGGNLGGVNTFGMTSGKWFCEMDIVAVGVESSIGISKGALTMSTYVGASADSWGYYSNGNKYTGGSPIAYGTSFTTGDTIGCAFDADLGLLSFYKNGIPYGVAYSGLTSGPYFFASSGRTATSANNVYLNFGQRPWSFGPPAGFKPVCVTSIPQPTIQKSSTAMDVVTYTGNGATSQDITGLSFSPDLVWLKSRTDAYDHRLRDVIRGDFALFSNLTNAESAYSLDFLSNGIRPTLGANDNINLKQYVAWAWKESPTSGMDIVSYTGNGTGLGVAHGLGVAPAMYITKSRSATTGWYVYHKSLSGNAIYLNSSSASVANSGQISSLPSSSFFSPGNHADVNTNGATYITYLFAEIEGYSKFGTYTGNASADGTFVYCGFSPRFILTKSTGVANWLLYDTERDTFNVASKYLLPDSSGVEVTSASYDILSNGFKLRASTSATFIFAAFAEAPFKYARAR